MKCSPSLELTQERNHIYALNTNSVVFNVPQEVMRNLVKRYVAAMIRDAKTEEGLTEENFKVTVSTLITRRQIPRSREPDTAHL